MSDRIASLRDRLGDREERIVRDWRNLAWPAGLATAWLGWYLADSLRHRREDRYGYEIGDRPSPSDPGFKAASEALTGNAATEGNEIELLINGDRIFPSILEAIRGAERTVNLESYVYWRGDIAREVAEALCERARAGVECRVLLDALGSAKMRPKILREMRSAGVEVHRFRPPKLYLLPRAAKRSHRRIITVDGRIGFTGGVGIASEWTGDAQDPDHWRDTHVRVEGPIVRALHGAFAEHWVETTGEALVGSEDLPSLEAREGGAPIQVVRSGKRVGDTTVELLYFLAISSAERSIDLTAAYFAPRPPFVKALCNAADRGVALRILVPGPHIDKSFARVAGRNVYEQLLDCGAEIHEYQPTMLHAKTMVVDGCWSSVGTVNFDNRSFQHHEELTLSVFDAGFAAALTEQFERDLERAEQIEPGRWSRRGPLQRLAEKAMVPLRREL